MFLGYQNDKIVFVAETREQLENMPCVSFDKIEETDKTYFLHNGEYVTEIPEPTKEEQQQARQQAYQAEVDPITCHIQRLGDEEQTAEIIAEIARLVEERKAKVEEIKARYPYPEVEEISPEPSEINENEEENIAEEISQVTE